jgi:MoxR-like ATPase
MQSTTKNLAQTLINNIAQAVLGKEEAIKLTVTAFIAGGHVLLEDMPGVGKTLLAKSLASSFEGKFKRIQFTSDIMPADITGNSVYNMKTSEFEFVPGPIFSHIILADEINRATPRSQSSLLEVMEEQQVTVDGTTHHLEKPFFVIATQNPLESYGTFPLPESQLDRFMLSLSMGYPNFEQELKILQLHRQNSQQNETTSLHQQLKAVISAADTQALQKQIHLIDVSDEMEKFILGIIHQTRIDSRLSMGASTRAAVAFLRACQALAYIEGRSFVIPDDVKFLAPYVLSHRIVTRQLNKRQDKDALIREISNDVFSKIKA